MALPTDAQAQTSPPVVTAPGVTVVASQIAIGNLFLLEGDALGSTYTIKLNAKPSGNVTVTPNLGGDRSLIASITPSVTFTPENWNQAQTVTVIAADDNDVNTNRTLLLTHTVSGGGYGGVPVQQISILLSDDEGPQLVVTPRTLNLTEGGSAGVFNVKLSAAPSGTAIVNVRRFGDVSVSSRNLTFTTSNWQTAKSVTVTVNNDNTDTGKRTGRITLVPVSGGYEDAYPVPVIVNITDDDRVSDAASITVGAPSNSTVAEDSSTPITYDVTLSEAPVGDTPVTIALAVTPSASSDKVTLSSSTLTFSKTDWAAKTVTVTPVNDTIDNLDRNFTITHTVSGGGYSSITAAPVTFTVTDDDAAPVMTFAATTNVAEGNAPSDSADMIFTATLSHASDRDVTVDYAVNATSTAVAGTDFTAPTQTQLTIPAGQQTGTFDVTVKGDAVVEPNETIIVDFTNPSNATFAGGVATLSATGTITNDDVAGVTTAFLSGDNFSLQENLTSDSIYYIKLNAKPSGNVTVVPAISDPSKAALVRPFSALTFTPDNWDTPQTVNIIPVNNTTKDGTQNLTITHTVTGGGYDLSAAGQVIGVITDDEGPQVVVTPLTLNLTEGGSAGTINVKLSEAPTANVLANIGPPRGISVSSSNLYFTTSNWNTPQPVTVTVNNDNTDTGDRIARVIVRVLPEGGYEDAFTVPVTVNITEDDRVSDAASITVGPPINNRIAENSPNPFTYDVTLSEVPVGDTPVTIALAVAPSASSDKVTLSPATLTFSKTDWAAQTVTVTPVNDTIDNLDRNFTINHTVSGGGFSRVTANPVTLTVIDDDITPVMTFAAADVVEGNTPSDSADMIFTATLSHASDRDITVDYAIDAVSSSAASGTDFTAPAQTQLTIPAGQTSATVAVPITGGGNTDVDIDKIVVMTFSNPSANVSLGAGSATGTITDNDVGSVSIANAPVAVVEDDASGSSYTITLGVRPAGNVRVAMAVTESGKTGWIQPIPDVIFTRDNWNTPQQVTIIPVNDNVINSNIRSLQIGHTITGSGYDGVAINPVAVSITDDESPQIIVSSKGLSLTEGGSAKTYNVKLNSVPIGGDVTVDLVILGNDATLSLNRLTFTASDWQTDKLVTVTPNPAVNDNVETAPRDLMLTHTVSGANFNSATSVMVPITIADDDIPTISVAATTVNEGDEGTDPIITFTASLSNATYKDVSFNYAVNATSSATGGTDYTALTGSVLTIPANSNSADLTVTVKGDDVAELDETIVIDFVHAPSRTTLSATGTITNDDTAGLTVAGGPLSMAEGVTRSYTIKLTSKPTSVVTVTPVVSDGTKAGLVTLAPVTIQPSDWNTATQVNVAAVDDEIDNANRSLRIIHTASGGGYNMTSADAVAPVDVTITDNDGPSRVIFSSPSVNEGDAGTVTLTFRVTLNIASGKQITVNYSDISSGTATSGTDYAPIAEAGLTFAPGEMEKTIDVTVNGDTEDEDAETIVLTFAHTGTASLVDGHTATGTINDDDGAAVIVSKSNLDMAENVPGTYTVRLNSQPTQTVTVALTSSDAGEATVSPATLTFTTADWETAQVVTVTPVNDTTNNDDRSLQITHAVTSTDNRYDSLRAAPVDVTITEDDPLPTINFDAPTVVEGDDGTSTLTFTATLSNASRRQVSFIYVDAGTGTATRRVDYASFAANRPIMVTIPAGQTTQTIAITVNGDTTSEPHETIALQFDVPRHARLGATTATGTIMDDDRSILSINAPTVDEGNDGTKTLTFTATLDKASDQIVSVDYSVSPSSTATSGTDYTEVADATLLIPVGQTSGTIALIVTGDTAFEADETIIMTFSNLSNANFVGTTERTVTATATITNDDAAPVVASDNKPPVVNAGSDQVVDEGVTVTLTGSASDPDSGDVLTYAWTQTSGPDVELSNAATATASFTSPAGENTLIFTLSVNDGTVSTADSVTVTVGKAAVAKKRFNEVNKAVTPQISQAMAENTLSAVTGRIGAAASDRASSADLTLAGQSSLPHALKSNQRAIDEGTLSLEDLLQGSSFVLPLNADGLKLVTSSLSAKEKQDNKSGASGASNRSGGLVLWGSGDYRKLSSQNKKTALTWKGKVLSAHLGVDTWFRDNVLIGLSVSRSKGTFKYGNTKVTPAVSGTYKSQMTSVHPYMSFVASDRLSLWGTVGLGSGDIDFDDVAVGKSSTSTSMQAAAVGANAKLISSDDLIAGGKTTLHLNSEASLARTKVKGAKLIDPSSANSRRIRVVAKGAHVRQLSPTRSLTPSVEIGLRNDSGDGVTGVGVEVGGGLKYTDRGRGLTIAGNARMLAAHRNKKHDEWGADFLIRLDPNADGEGLSLSLAPGYGPSQSKVGQLWDKGLDTRDEVAGRRLDAEIGYGIAVSNVRGLLTPYGGLALAEQNKRTYRLGGRFKIDRHLETSLEASHQEMRTQRRPNTGLMLKGRLNW
ncbi:PKD domain-containing protein [Alphaproteobacteria bacterium]|nr:PKD domain-containing protein [Alphaproteobacteria bacterium]